MPVSQHTSWPPSTRVWMRQVSPCWAQPPPIPWLLRLTNAGLTHAELNGSYLEDCKPVKREEMLPWGRDPIDAERLWKTGEKLVSQDFTY